MTAAQPIRQIIISSKENPDTRVARLECPVTIAARVPFITHRFPP